MENNDKIIERGKQTFKEKEKFEEMKLKKDDIVQIIWRDATSSEDFPIHKIKNPTEMLSVCKNVGFFVGRDKGAICVATQISDDLKMDLLVIPLSWTIKIIKLKGKLENGNPK